MEIISEHKINTLTEITLETQSKDTNEFETLANKSTKKVVERRSERQKIKKQIFANGQSENSPKKLELENKKNLGSKITTDYSSKDSQEENLLNKSNPTYEFYKQQGDYWK